MKFPLEFQLDLFQLDFHKVVLSSRCALDNGVKVTLCHEPSSFVISSITVWSQTGSFRLEARL